LRDDISAADQQLRVTIMVFNATFNNISVILYRSVLLVEETEIRGEKNNLPQVTEKRHHTWLHRVYFVWAGFKFTVLVVIDTDLHT
jgi:hypothetical protein